jgi:hypothetical protein
MNRGRQGHWQTETVSLPSAGQFAVADKEQFATPTVPSSQASIEQMQVPVSIERQHLFSSTGSKGGHSNTGLPWTAALTLKAVPH